MIMIAVAAAIVVPRDLREARDLVIQGLAVATGVMIDLAVHFHRHAREPNSGNPDFTETRDTQQDAGLRAGVLLLPAEFFPNTARPNRPGCIETHCEQMWNHELQRPFRRCYWRCPRRAPPPSLPSSPPAPPR